MEDRQKLRVIGVATLILILLVAGSAMAQAIQTPVQAMEVTCSATTGEYRQSGNVLHIRDEIHRNQVVSDDPRIDGINTVVINAEINLTNGSGGAHGSFRLVPEGVNGAWEGSWSGHFDNFALVGQAVAQGTGELSGMIIRVTLQEIPLSELNQNPCSSGETPSSFSTVTGLIIDPPSG